MAVQLSAHRIVGNAVRLYWLAFTRDWCMKHFAKVFSGAYVNENVPLHLFLLAIQQTLSRLPSSLNISYSILRFTLTQTVTVCLNPVRSAVLTHAALARRRAHS